MIEKLLYQASQINIFMHHKIITKKIQEGIFQKLLVL